jgi:hypothetical protein
MLTIIVPLVCTQSVVALCQMLNKVANDGSGTNTSATKLVSPLKFFLHWQSLKIFAINVTVLVFLVKQVPGRGPEQRESG